MNASSTTNLLTVEGLSVSIGEKPVLHDVSFSIAAGASLALVGESGSGKSVTSRAISGLLDRVGGTVTGGTVSYKGEDLLAHGVRKWGQLRGSEIALVPQASLSSLNPVRRIGAQIGETVSVLDRDSNVFERSRELLDQVQLPRISEVLRSYPHELSGGMRQRVMIALALAGRPKFMIADEPTTALDVTVQEGILRLLTELRAETGMSLLMIAHDLGVVSMVSEQVAVMRSGRIIEAGPTAQVLTTPNHPYTQALLAARPDSSKPGTPLAILDRDSGLLHRPAPLPQIDLDRKTPVLRAQNVSITFKRAAKPAVAPFDLDIYPGESLGIVGESGSGKTTLGRMLVGALTPTTGSVSVEGKSWNQVKYKDPVRGRVQMIFQDPYGSLTPWRTARDTVAEVLARWEKLSRSDSRERAGQLLDEVGLPQHTFDRTPAKLSGGQCQRIGIARALASSPRVLVADEPTSSLDISAQAQILNLLMALRASRGLSLVVVSHDLTVIQHVTDNALVMRNGEVVEQGSSVQLFSNPSHEYTQRLVASTPTMVQI